MRGAVLTAVLALAAVVVAPLSHGSGRVLRLHLAGFGVPLAATTACPEGQTSIPITLATALRIGTARLCVLAVRKHETGEGGIRRIVQSVLETDSLPGGTLKSVQTQTITFGSDQRHTTAIFRGRVLRGTGRFAGAHGTISGRGPGYENTAAWVTAIRLATALPHG
jgi:hypothetical protein